MKKVLSIALVLSMLLAMMVPMAVAAEGEATGAATIGDLVFYDQTNAGTTPDGHTSNTGFDAFKGTPTMDGKVGEGEAWANALPLIVNNDTYGRINGINWGAGRNVEYYLTWDENALYFLEINNAFDWSKVTKTSIDGGNLWSGGFNGTQLTVVFNSALTDGASYGVSQINSMPIEKNGVAASSYTVGTQYQGSTNVRARSYKYDATAKTISGGGGSWVTTTDKINSYFTKTGNSGLVMETKIPWSYFGITEAVTATTTPYIGVSIYSGGTTILKPITGRDGIAISGDITGGYDPICLLNDKSQAEGGTDRTFVESALITPDVDFFVAEGTGVLRTAGEATIEIDSAEKLLGLSHAMENYTYDSNTKGKTFVITKDINLNPALSDWTDFSPESEMMYWKKVPLNIWLSLDEFYGNIEGQGHVISGFYSPNAAHGSKSATGDWGLFGGRKPEGYVKNIIIGGGYIRDNDNGGFGLVWAVSYHTAAADANATSAIENVFVADDFTMVINKTDAGSQAGPLINGPWSNTGGTLHVDIKNVVINAKVIVTDTNVATVGNCFGVWRFNDDKSYGGSKFTLTASDIIIKNKVVSNGTVGDTIGGKDGVTRATYAPKGLPAKNADIWTETTMGIMPNQVADMLAEYAWQSTAAENGKYNVRIIGEAFDMDFATMGFKVRLIKNNSEVADFDNAENKVVYMSVMAANETKTAADLNAGLYDGENGLYVLTLNGLDANATYTIEVTSIWTLEDGTTVESVVAKTTTVSAYVPSAS